MASSWNAPSWKSVKRGTVVLVQEADGHFYKVVLSNNTDDNDLLEHLQAGNPRRLSFKRQLRVALTGSLVQSSKDSDSQSLALDRLIDIRTKKGKDVDSPAPIRPWHVDRQWYRHQKDDAKYFLRQLSKTKSSNFTAFEPVPPTGNITGDDSKCAFLIKEEGTRFYHVGLTEDTDTTLAILQAGNPRDLTLEKTIPVEDPAKVHALEEQLQRWHVKGKGGGKQWYRVHDEKDEGDFMSVFESCSAA